MTFFGQLKSKLRLSPKTKRIASFLILLTTLVLFAYYIKSHPGLLDSLGDLTLGLAILILALYSLILVTNAFILHWSVELCSRTIPKVESVLLTSYSSLVNFFGPLQSGPGFRLLYLKKKHQVSAKAYGVATLLYYGIFGVTNVLFVLYGVSPVLSGAILALSVIGGLMAIPYVSKRYPSAADYISQIIKIGLVTIVQVAVMVAIFYVELSVVDNHIALSQAIVYTGAANLALFVSLTPGAVGIRESFLLFTQNLHDLGTHTIVAASVIDRAIYFVFLGLLFLFASSLHLGSRFKRAVPDRP